MVDCPGVALIIQEYTKYDLCISMAQNVLVGVSATNINLKGSRNVYLCQSSFTSSHTEPWGLFLLTLWYRIV